MEIIFKHVIANRIIFTCKIKGYVLNLYSYICFRAPVTVYIKNRMETKRDFSDFDWVLVPDKLV